MEESYLILEKLQALRVAVLPPAHCIRYGASMYDICFMVDSPHDLQAMLKRTHSSAGVEAEVTEKEHTIMK